MKTVTASCPPASPVTAGGEPDSLSSRRTRRQVALSILAHGPSTAAELADRLELTAAGVRRHLDALVADGLLEARDQHQRGPRGRGRPAKVFRLTAAGRDEYHQAYDQLAAGALAFLEETAGPDAVQDFAARRLAPLAERLRPLVESADPQERVTALAEALSAEGYPAVATSTDAGTAQLCQHSCPVAHVAEAFPQLCAAETALIAGLLGTHVQRLATIAHGDGVCTTHIPTATVGTSQHDPAAPGFQVRRTSV